MGGFGDGVLDALNRAGIRVPLLQGRAGRGVRAPRRGRGPAAPAADRCAGDPGPDPRRARPGGSLRLEPRRALERKRRLTGVARVRLDQLLVTRGLAPSRAAAQALLLAGEVELGGAGSRTLKPGQLVDDNVPVSVVARRRWASRAGEKLRGGARRLRDRSHGAGMPGRRRLNRWLHGRAPRPWRADRVCGGRRAGPAARPPGARSPRDQHGAHQPADTRPAS